MKFYEAIAAGIKHIQENKTRAGLSILGIFIGIASVLCMIAIGDGAKQTIADDIEKIGGTNQILDTPICQETRPTISNSGAIYFGRCSCN